MRLNSIKSAAGARRASRRVGRGIGSGLGKTGGRGHKGQKSRSGGFHKVGFEGGQMPLQRRLPKVGFHAYNSRYRAEVRLGELGRVEGDVADPASLKAAGVVPGHVRVIKVFLSGKLERPVTVRGLRISKGARAAVEAAGGKVED